MDRRALIAAGVAALVSCGRGALWAGETGRIAAVRNGHLVVLDQGLSARLVGIEAPMAARRDLPAQPFAQEARDMLWAAAYGRRCQLFYGGLTRDRYERALAHVMVYSDDGAATWLNGHMVARGAARVRTWPDNRARGHVLLRAEALARRSGIGLWARAVYAPVRAAMMAAKRGQFALVEDDAPVVGEIAGEESHVRADGTGRMIVGLGRRLRRVADRIDIAGHGIRVRGRVRVDRDGAPMIALTHWLQVEVI